MKKTRLSLLPDVEHDVKDDADTLLTVFFDSMLTDTAKIDFCNVFCDGTKVFVTGQDIVFVKERYIGKSAQLLAACDTRCSTAFFASFNARCLQFAVGLVVVRSVGIQKSNTAMEKQATIRILYDKHFARTAGLSYSIQVPTTAFDTLQSSDVAAICLFRGKTNFENRVIEGVASVNSTCEVFPALIQRKMVKATEVPANCRKIVFKDEFLDNLKLAIDANNSDLRSKTIGKDFRNLDVENILFFVALAPESEHYHFIVALDADVDAPQCVYFERST